MRSRQSRWFPRYRKEGTKPGLQVFVLQDDGTLRERRPPDYWVVRPSGRWWSFWECRRRARRHEADSDQYRWSAYRQPADQGGMRAWDRLGKMAHRDHVAARRYRRMLWGRRTAFGRPRTRRIG